MKFASKSRLKEQVIDFVAKGILILFSGLVCLWMISGAKASSTDILDIESRQTTEGGFEIDFLFSKNLKKEDVQVEFQRNFIQISFRGVSAYPARTQKFNHSITDKVFTYQYQPDLARARILLKSSATTIQKSASWNVEGKTMSVKLAGGSATAALVKDEVKNASSSVASKVSKNAASANDIAAAKEVVEDPEEEKIREALLSGTSKLTEEKKSSLSESTENLPIFAKTEAASAEKEAKKESPAAKVFASLILVIGLIAAGALAFRKFVMGKNSPFQKQTRMIQVISTQSLGPKRSIAVVKVLDQHLVLGMSGDSMSLLTNLGNNVNLDSFSDEVGSGISFSDTLCTAVRTDAFDREESKSFKASTNLGFRANLKKRLEGFKQL
jgi:flagellar biosynthetic protein FliO